MAASVIGLGDMSMCLIRLSRSSRLQTADIPCKEEEERGRVGKKKGKTEKVFCALNPQ